MWPPDDPSHRVGRRVAPVVRAAEPSGRAAARLPASVQPAQELQPSSAPPPSATGRRPVVKKVTTKKPVTKTATTSPLTGPEQPLPQQNPPPINGSAMHGWSMMPVVWSAVVTVCFTVMIVSVGSVSPARCFARRFEWLNGEVDEPGLVSRRVQIPVGSTYTLALVRPGCAWREALREQPRAVPPVELYAPRCAGDGARRNAHWLPECRVRGAIRGVPGERSVRRL